MSDTAVLDPPAEKPTADPPAVPDVPATPVVETLMVSAATVVPETYDLKLPDGSTVDPAIVERTATTARALGLTNEAGQQLLDAVVAEADVVAKAAGEQAIEAKRIADIEANKPGGAEWVKRDAEWRKAAEADSDIGGSPDKLAVSVEKAQQAITKYGTPEIKQFLHETGLGSHPAVLRFLARIGKAMGEGSVVMPGQQSNSAPKSHAEILYGPDGMGPKPTG